MYDQKPDSFEALVAPVDESIKKIGEAVRDAILQTLPKAEENIYGGKKVANALYSVGGTNNVICGIQPAKDFIRVFFHNWEALEAAGYKLEGSGKHARHLKVRDMAELDQVELAKMLKIAAKR